MTNTSIGNEVSRLAFLRENQYLQSSDSSFTEMSYKSIEKNSEELTVDQVPNDERVNQLWPYQTCTEFGFYQTCDVGSGCFFTQGLDRLADEVSFCIEEFKIDPSLVALNVEQTNTY